MVTPKTLSAFFLKNIFIDKIMRHYTTNGGGAFNNFGEVVDYLKNNNYAVLVKDCPQFRAFLLKNDGVYTLKIHYLAKDYWSAYYEKQYEFGERLTAKKIAKIEALGGTATTI